MRKRYIKIKVAILQQSTEYFITIKYHEKFPVTEIYKTELSFFIS